MPMIPLVSQWYHWLPLVKLPQQACSVYRLTETDLVSICLRRPRLVVCCQGSKTHGKQINLTCRWETLLSIYLRILPTPSRAFLAGTARLGYEKAEIKVKRVIVSLFQDDRLNLDR